MYIYGQEPCESGNCEHRCMMCGMNTLAYIQPNTNDSETGIVKQMVGEAQRLSRNTGRVGDIEVSRTISGVNGDFQTRILVYNTYSKYSHIYTR